MKNEILKYGIGIIGSEFELHQSSVPPLLPPPPITRTYIYIYKYICIYADTCRGIAATAQAVVAHTGH